MRSILVTVDDTPSCVTARVLGVALARRTGAALRGVTAIEVSDINRVEPFPVGGAEYAYARLKHREQQAKERRSRIADLPTAFQSAVASEGIEVPCSTIEGDVRGGLLRMIETCDLLITGRDAEFHLEPLDGVTPLVEHVIARGCRPVVVTGPTAIEDGPVLVAYDGSAPAAKALQLAAVLGMFGSSSAHILTVQGEGTDARQIATRARNFLALHDVKAEIEACVSSDDPADILMRRAVESRARLLVMGAFGHRGFREILFGSCTRRLFDSAPLPLFIYH